VKPQSFISKVIADGRVTIPKEMREKKGINEGDFVEVQLIRKIDTSNSKEA
jgi:AbrB family looped-hinge helix DNA binding protein